MVYSRDTKCFNAKNDIATDILLKVHIALLTTFSHQDEEFCNEC